MKLGEVHMEYMNLLIINDFSLKNENGTWGKNNLLMKSLQCLFLNYLSHNNSINIQNGFMCSNNELFHFYVFKN